MQLEYRPTWGKEEYQKTPERSAGGVDSSKSGKTVRLDGVIQGFQGNTVIDSDLSVNVEFMLAQFPHGEIWAGL